MKQKTYFPLILILFYLLLTTISLEWLSIEPNFVNWMHNFMGGFFIVFSFFKFLDLSGFVSTFKKYDLIAAKIPAYGYLYPFIELLLGMGFILKWQLHTLNYLTVVVMFLSSLGVISSLLNKQKIQCACLGTVFNLPMSTVTLVEDLLMLAMALWSLNFNLH